MLNSPPPVRCFGLDNGLLAPFEGAFQQADSLKFYQVSSNHREGDSSVLSQPQNTAASAAAHYSKIPSTNVEQAKVAILLATYQGQHYLAEQLDSFARQTHQNWEVWASDDGSSDDTHAILKHYEKHWPFGRLSIHNGPEEGFVANFLSLTCKASISADYYAYADQDDIWKADKPASCRDR